MTRGRFITFEGPEGSGKSTHLQRLADHLRRRGRRLVLTREPGGTPLGEALRGLLQHDTGGEAPAARAEVLLFCASRAQLAEKIILPALERGEWVLCDRFSDSTFAYQGHGRGFDPEDLRIVNRFATGGLEPDLTLLLDVDTATSRKRLADRQGRGIVNDRFEQEGNAFHDRLRNGFLALAQRHPHRLQVIDARREIDVVAEEIRQRVDRRFEALQEDT